MLSVILNVGIALFSELSFESLNEVTFAEGIQAYNSLNKAGQEWMADQTSAAFTAV